MVFNFSKKKKDEFYLDDIIQCIGESVARAKARIDVVAVQARRESHEHDEIMKTLPFNTFKISDVEVDLKFMVTRIETQEASQSIQRDKIKDIIRVDDDPNKDMKPLLNKRIIVNMDMDELVKVDPNILCKITYKMVHNKISEYTVDDKNIILEHADDG